MIYNIPYGERYESVFIENATVLEAGGVENDAKKSQESIVLEAMASPIESPTLAELAFGKRNAVIIISDHTRPVPSKVIIPAMLRQLRESSPKIEVTLLVATGCHRGTTTQELIHKLGEEIVASEKIVVHDCEDQESIVSIGVLPSGAPLMINRLAVETELLLAEGFIEPHFFAGFSGGRKSVLPGICSRETVLGNHCSSFIDDPASRTGVLRNNPIHADMIAAARLANLAYIVNVAIDEEKKVIAAFAGHPEKAHEKGCELVDRPAQVVAKPGDIVITSNGGYPLDQNVYQCVKSLTTAEASAKPDAILIICAECRDGTGGDAFYRDLRDAPTIESLYEKILKVPMDKTAPDQWQTQILARILLKHRVIFVTRPELQQTIRDMKLDYAPSLAVALACAQAIKGDDCDITVIPNGIAVIVR